MTFRRLHIVRLSCFAAQLLSLPGIANGAEPPSLQDKAAATFEALGAKVMRNDKGDVTAIVLRDSGDPFDKLPLITEETFTQIKNCPELKQLELYGLSVIDHDVANFSKLKKLEHLNVGKTKISADGIREIATMHRLKHLSLRGVDISDEDLPLLEPLTNLEYLDLRATDVRLGGLIALAPLTKLKKLDFNALTNDGLKHLPELIKIPWFIRATDFTNKSGPKLTTLALRTNAINDEALLHVKALADLETLILASSRVTGEGLKNLKDLPNLTRLFIGDTRITDENLAALPDLESVRYLRLSTNDIGDNAMRHVAKMPNLEFVVISWTNVTDAGLMHLKDAPKLKKIFASRTKITPKGVAKFRVARPDVEGPNRL